MIWSIAQNFGTIFKRGMNKFKPKTWNNYKYYTYSMWTSCAIVYPSSTMIFFVQCVSMALPSSIRCGRTGVKISRALLTTDLASAAWALSKLWNTCRIGERKFIKEYFVCIWLNMALPFSIWCRRPVVKLWVRFFTSLNTLNRVSWLMILSNGKGCSGISLFSINELWEIIPSFFFT